MGDETKETKPVFDSNRPIGIKVRTPKGIEKISVRFPTDDEWIERQRKRKIVTKDLGSGMSQTSVAETDEVDAALLAQIRIGDDGIEVDGYEATSVFDRLQRAEVVGEVTREAGQFCITLRVLGGIETTHVMRMPTAREEIRYRKSITQSIDSRSMNQTTIHLSVAGDFYKALLVRNAGYSGPVPIVHMAVVMPRLMEETKILLGEDDSENF